MAFYAEGSEKEPSRESNRINTLKITGSTQVENMNNLNRGQYKYSTPNHQKISIDQIIDFLGKIFSLC